MATTHIEEVMEEFDKKFPFVDTELGEDRPVHKISDIRAFTKQALTSLLEQQKKSKFCCKYQTTKEEDFCDECLELTK